MKKILLSLLLLSLYTITFTHAQDYTSELQTAYDYAYSIGITTQPSIDGANMYGSLIRSHMAKMMVNYSKEVLGITPDTSLPCAFTDIANESTELKGYITQACQMGLMGVGITAFSPTTVVTRAQFGTVLSRALYGDMFNDGDPYYVNHLQALNAGHIMNSISNPNASEVRGYVMLMMMRAGGDVQDTSSPCDSQENQLACMVGSANCPVECQGINEITTIAGTLKLNSTTITVGGLPSNAKYIGSLKLTATDQDIILKSLTFQKFGAFTKGRIEDDGVKITSFQSIASDTTITTSFTPGLIIKQGLSKTLSIFLESNSNSDQGVILTNTKNIKSSASVIDGSFPYRLVK